MVRREEQGGEQQERPRHRTEHPERHDRELVGILAERSCAGKVGFQVGVNPKDLSSLIRFTYADLTADG